MPNSTSETFDFEYQLTKSGSTYTIHTTNNGNGSAAIASNVTVQDPDGGTINSGNPIVVAGVQFTFIAQAAGSGAGDIIVENSSGQYFLLSDTQYSSKQANNLGGFVTNGS